VVSDIANEPKRDLISCFYILHEAAKLAVSPFLALIIPVVFLIFTRYSTPLMSFGQP